MVGSSSTPVGGTAVPWNSSAPFGVTVVPGSGSAPTGGTAVQKPLVSSSASSAATSKISLLDVSMVALEGIIESAKKKRRVETATSSNIAE